MKRRDALVIGAAFATAIAIPPVLRRLPSDFDFQPMPAMPGFRRLAAGAVSGFDPFTGIGDRMPAPADPATDTVFSPCLALFGTKDWDPQRLPVAVFSDFNCPFCKDFENHLISLEASGAPIRLIWHEYPLLGDASYRAAKAVIAARSLGVGDKARDYLWANVLRPGRVGLRRMAEALNISGESFAHSVNNRRTIKTLADSLALGARLGLPGTPGTVVGRTLVVGAIKPVDLDRLITLERNAGPMDCS